MYTIIDTDGRLQHCEGIDINVWYDEETEGIRLTAYKMYRMEDGLWDTNTDVVLFWAVTDFESDQFDDEWYGLSEDTLPHEIPADVLDLVNRVLAEVDMGDTPVYAEVLASDSRRTELREEVWA
jgi:hypothetical protein